MLLDEIIHEDTATLEIKNDLGMAFDKPAHIEFFGPDTEEQRRAYSKQRKGLIKADGDDEEILRVQCQCLVDMTKGVEGIELKDGRKKRAATIKDMMNIYIGAVSIRAQAMLFVGHEVNFMKGREES